MTAAAHTCAAAQLEGCTGLLAQGGDASTAVLPVDAVCLPARQPSAQVALLVHLRIQLRRLQLREEGAAAYPLQAVGGAEPEAEPAANKAAPRGAAARAEAAMIASARVASARDEPARGEAASADDSSPPGWAAAAAAPPPTHKARACRRNLLHRRCARTGRDR